ncbi:MAG: MerR family transcriptional regulator [Candidatus Poribacteria bacterium]|nr:MerR family transcriptional regulator [Candidatus Poribacteria bacterium]
MAVYTIYDLALQTGVSYHTVYYYIREGLLEADKIAGTRVRIFGDNGLTRLQRIINLRNQGNSIESIRKILIKENNNAKDL